MRHPVSRRRKQQGRPSDLRICCARCGSGFKSLLLHKLRTGLAMLGILIGVTAVIWLVALGEGVSYQAQKQIEDLGATNIIIKSVKPPAGGQAGGGGSTRVIAYGLTRRTISTFSSSSRRSSGRRRCARS